VLSDADKALQEARAQFEGGHYGQALEAVKGLNSRITAQIGALDLVSRGRTPRTPKKRR
jgi:hypothetical protein